MTGKEVTVLCSTDFQLRTSLLRRYSVSALSLFSWDGLFLVPPTTRRRKKQSGGAWLTRRSETHDRFPISRLWSSSSSPRPLTHSSLPLYAPAACPSSREGRMWPFKRHRQDPGTDQSRMALQDAQCSLKVIASRHEEVTGVASELRKIRRDNHFSEHLMRIMTGDGK